MRYLILPRTLIFFKKIKSIRVYKVLPFFNLVETIWAWFRGGGKETGRVGELNKIHKVKGGFLVTGKPFRQTLKGKKSRTKETPEYLKSPFCSIRGHLLFAAGPELNRDLHNNTLFNPHFPSID